MRRLMLILSIVVISGGVFSQTDSGFRSIDSTSFALYEQKKWKELSQFGEQSIEQGTDYFYLRMRTGIAWYEMEKYRSAIPHFIAALKFSNDDLTAKEYLFYSYLFSGRKEDAMSFLAGDKKLREKIGAKRNVFIAGLNMNVAYALNNNIEKNGTTDIDGTGNNFGVQDLNGNSWYVSAGILHRPLKRISFFHAFNSLTIDKQKRFTGRTPFGASILPEIEKYSLEQKEYYIRASCLVAPGLVISPAFHFLNVSYSSFTSSLNPPGSIPLDTSFANYAGAVSISKETGIFNFGINGVMAGLNGNKQLQFGLTVLTYPLRNLNFYTKSSITFQQDNGPSNVLRPVTAMGRAGPGGPMGPNAQGSENEQNWIFYQLAGVKLLSKCWFEGNVSVGTMHNYFEENLYIVHNSADVIKLRIGGALLFPINSKLDISFRGMYCWNESYYIKYNFSPGLLGPIYLPEKITTPYKSLVLSVNISLKI